MKIFPGSSIYNLRAIGKRGSILFGRYCKNLKEVKSEVINHKWILKIDYVIYKNKIHLMKDIFKL